MVPATHTLPVRYGLGSFPAQVSQRWSCIWDPLIRRDAGRCVGDSCNLTGVKLDGLSVELTGGNRDHENEQYPTELLHAFSLQKPSARTNGSRPKDIRAEMLLPKTNHADQR